MKKILTNKKLYIALLIISIITVLTAVFCNFRKTESVDNKFDMSNEYYQPMQYEIGSGNSPTDTSYYVISMTAAIEAGTVEEGYRVSISTAEELYLFSQITNSNDNFLSYYYYLVNDIDYSETNKLFIPIGWNKKQFDGTFDGRGYEISNLKFLPITSDNQDTYAKNIEYYAMFSHIGTNGTICNLGLINPMITINTYISGVLGVSNLIGKNEGTVDHVYVKDLQNPYEENGITADGGYLISGLMCENSGIFTNSYVAFSIVVNFTIKDYVSFTEILDTNDDGGTYSNLYVYNSSIVECTKAELVYDSGLVGKTYANNNYATYVTDKSMLCVNEDTSVLDAGWYNNNSYHSSISGYFSIDTPVLNGLTYNSNTKSFSINNEDDYAYMYKLMNMNSFFASDDVKYLIYNDLNLNNIPSSVFSYNGSISSTFEGVKGEYTNTVSDIKGGKSSYPTIYNAPVTNFVVTEGVECYGIFPWLTGTVKNLNFYNENEINSIDSTSSNIKAIGLVAGYVEGGTIDNVNVYSNINITNSIGKYYAGGITGVLGGNGSISSCTTAGSIIDNNGHNTFTDIKSTGYVEGISVGGVIGYISNTSGDVVTCLSATTLTLKLFTESTENSVAVGGVIGSGYTKNVNSLTNKANITVGRTEGSYYSSLHVAGVIGRHLGVSSQVSAFHNQGDIIVYSNTNDTKIAGVSNVDLVTAATDTLTPSNFKNSSAQYIYYANSFTNASTINIYNNRNENMLISGVANILSGNGFISEISGFYNLEYKYAVTTSGYVNTQITDTQEIDISIAPYFAGCVISTATSCDHMIDSSYVYNFRDIEFITSNSSSYSIETKYSGCILGQYFNLNEIRNEGLLNFTISNNYQSNKFIVTGVFETVSTDCSANFIYNAGNIQMDYSSEITANVYLSGICYEVKNGLIETELLEYNPVSETFDNNKVGVIDNVINNGDIICTSTTYESATYNSENFTGINGQQTIGTKYTVTLSKEEAVVVGNVNCSGITYINESVITNAFNLGDILATNYINSSTINEINAAGISTLNIGKYAYIENSANNGAIKAMNLSSSEYSNVNAAGITVRNDKTAEGSDYSGGNGHAEQMIAFTINYGSVYSYNYCDNIESSASEARTKSAGILAMGLCNIINTVNYGNIYGSETASGIFGIVYFQKFTSDVNENNKINLANSINYGNVWCIEKGYNHFTDSSLTNQTYLDFVEMTDNNKDEYAKVKVEVEYVDRNTFIGSIFAIVNFNSDTNANNVSIRYLISFLENVNLVGAEASTPSSINIDVSNMYSAFYEFTNGLNVYDTYMGQTVVYSPLSTTEVDGYDGVFSEEFAFRKAIEGEAASSNVVTDKFLSDYFQFVAYQKINDHLLDKIGWRTIAYYTAANDFAQDLDAISKFLSSYQNISGNTYSNLLTESLNTDSWMIYSTDKILTEITEEYIKNDDFDSLMTLLEYIFSTDFGSSIFIDNNVRIDLFNVTLEYLEEKNRELELSTMLYDVLDFENGISTILADSVLSSGTQNDIVDYLEEYVSFISIEDKKSIIEAYLIYLQNGNDYFDMDGNAIKRMELLNSIFASISDEQFYELLFNSLEFEDSTYTDEMKMYIGYNSMTNEEKAEMFSNLVLNTTDISTYIDSMYSEINFYEELISNGYVVSDVDDVYSLIDITNTNASNETTINERVNLYNQIKGTKTFNNYINSRITNTIYALATEHNNTFQSTTAPSNSGAYSGDLAYSYTDIISPSTYYYGPYSDSNGNFNISQTWGSQTIFTEDSYVANDYYYSVFITNDSAKVSTMENNNSTYDFSTFYYEYGASGTNNQLCQDYYFTQLTQHADPWKSSNSDFSGSKLKLIADDGSDIILTDSFGVEFNAGGGVLSACTRTNTSSYNETDAATYTITDVNGKVNYMSGTIGSYVDIIRNYAIEYYIARPTTNFHSTQRTGIYMYAETWNNIKVYYFTWKNSSSKVYTTQYIDYSVDQLLSLDGVLTGYDKATISNDERNIINDIFNSYFCSDSSNFKVVIERALLESLGSNVDYIDEFIINNIYSDVTINSTKPMDYLVYSGSVKASGYLEGLFTTDDSYKDKLVITASVDVSSYVKLIKELLAIDISTSSENSELYKSYYDTLEYIRLNDIIGSAPTGDLATISKIAEDVGITDDLIITTSQINGSNLRYSKVSQGTYTYGIKFESIDLSLNSNTQSVKFIAMPSSNATNLTISDGDNTSTISITSYGEYSYNPTNKNITISSNGDIILYDIYEDIMLEGSSTYSYSNEVQNRNTGTFVSESDIISNIKNYIINSNSLVNSDNITITLKTVNATATIENAETGTSYYAKFSGQTNSITTDEPITTNGTINGTCDVSIVIYDKTNSISDFEKTWNIYRGINENNVTTQNNNMYATNMLYETEYDYNYTYENDLLSLGDFTVTTPRVITEADYSNLLTDYISGYFIDVTDEEYSSFANSVILNLIPVDSGDSTNKIWIAPSVLESMNSDEKSELVKIIFTYSNDAFIQFIQEYARGDDRDLLVEIISTLTILNYQILSELLSNDELTDDFKQTLVAAYIVTDYTNIYNQSLENTAVNVSQTILNDLLSIFELECQYINSDGSFNNDYFENLCKKIGYSLATNGYGIYALSSSKGILNGQFIPDNLVLDDFKAKYTNNGDYWELSTTLSNDWRGSSETEGTVSYAISVEMKQLKKSISTTIFTLDLITQDGNAIILYSSESTIDLESGIITYYIPNSYLDSESSLSVKINKESIAENATMYLNGNDDLTSSFDLKYGYNSNIIKVKAEDQTISKDYIINLVGMDVDFDIAVNATLSTNLTTTNNEYHVPYKDGVIAVDVISDTLPSGLDLTPYISIKSSGENSETIDDVFELKTNPIIDENHDTIMYMQILNKLPHGTYIISVKIFDIEKTITFIKDESEECNIEKIQFEGKNVQFDSGLEATNTIPFGRAFTYDELYNLEYLNQFEVSLGASYTVNVSKSEDEESKLMTYTVEIKVEAENEASQTYYHYLIEAAPFESNDNYAAVYKDGNIDYNAVYAGNKYISRSFERGEEPTYRVKYNLNNFYTLGDNISYVMGEVEYDYIVCSVVYNGLQITVTNDVNVGEYSFEYKYISTSTWENGEEYTREYSFGSFVISKLPSTDSLLHKVTFLNTNKVQGALATVMYPNAVIRPGGTLADGEQLYSDLSDVTNTPKISVTDKTIIYDNQGVDYSKEKDYFLVGSLSNVELSRYAPTFKIEEHGQIYQYTTKYKIQNYGKELQEDLTDYEVLTNKEFMLLYVPFTDGTNVEVFLVELDENNAWSNIYTTDYNVDNATDTLVHTIVNGVTSFEYNDKTWEIDVSVGQSTDNDSLYMDYIGTPQDDHFWFVSYVVFSEDYLANPSGNSNYQCYHVSLIDVTNNVYYDIVIDAPTVNVENLYLTIVTNVYTTVTNSETLENEEVKTQKQISAFAAKDSSGMYVLTYNLQMLPNGYTYFYIDLPDGYVAKCSVTNDKANTNVDGNTSYKANEDGAYKPVSTIVTQKISILIEIVEGENGVIWGEATTDAHTRLVEFINKTESSD